MFSKKIKEIKRTKTESEVLLARSNVLLSKLRKEFQKEFKENLKKVIKKPVKIKFSQFDFGTKKKNQDAAIIKILFVNDAFALDNRWCDGSVIDRQDATAYVPFSVEWLEEFCRNQSEILGINIVLDKK